MSSRWKSHPHDTVPMKLLDDLSTKVQSRNKTRIRGSGQASTTESRSCSPNRRAGNRRSNNPRSATSKMDHHRHHNPRDTNTANTKEDDYDVTLITKNSESSDDKRPTKKNVEAVFRGAEVVRSEIMKTNSYDNSRDGKQSHASVSSKDVLEDLGLTLREQMILATQVEAEVFRTTNKESPKTYSPRGVSDFNSNDPKKAISLDRGGSRSEISRSGSKSMFKLGSMIGRSKSDVKSDITSSEITKKTERATTTFRNRLQGHLFAPEKQHSFNPRSFGKNKSSKSRPSKSLAEFNPQRVELMAPIPPASNFTSSTFAPRPTSIEKLSANRNRPTRSSAELSAVLSKDPTIERPSMSKRPPEIRRTTKTIAVFPPPEIQNSTPFKHARNAGKVWQTLVGEFVRFPTIWFAGRDAPSLDENDRAKWSYVCLMRHRNRHLSSYVRNERSRGRILLHVRFTDAYGSGNVNCVRDLAIGCFHPNSKRVYRKNPWLEGERDDDDSITEDTEDGSYRDVWMALRKVNDGAGAKISSLESWLTMGHSIETIGRSSPISSNRRSVSNDNVKYIFGDEPPLQTVMIRANDLNDLLLQSKTSPKGASSSPVNLLLRKYVYKK